MERVEKVDCSSYPHDFIRAAIAVLYWFPLRRSEVFGDSGRKWKLQPCLSKKRIQPEVRCSKPFLGLLKENIWVDEKYIYLYQIAVTCYLFLVSCASFLFSSFQRRVQVLGAYGLVGLWLCLRLVMSLLVFLLSIVFREGFDQVFVKVEGLQSVYENKKEA